MTTPNAEELLQRLRAQGLEPVAYSGRGMYGAECVGVAVDNKPGRYDLPTGWAWDNLGLGFIIYWPAVPWPGGAGAADGPSAGQSSR